MSYGEFPEEWEGQQRERERIFSSKKERKGRRKEEASMVVCNCNLHTWEAEAGR